ncbi:hypothetical protein MMC29_000097 [Sticta canariensis]|nr:hypothetical protein [Sticta canariensis]
MKERQGPLPPKSSNPIELADEGNVIEPLLNFDLWKVEPIQYRPYKSQGHVSMGILKQTRNEWIRMDRGYLARVQNRKHLIQNKAEFTIGTGPLVDPAIEELYSEIMIDYLPNRYPTIFKKHEKAVHNVVTGSTYPLSTTGLKPEQMLEYLGTNVEEDFYLMCPDKIDGEFRLRGYIACFPGGFLSPARVGESVREIHQPVPGYEERLGKSVDRYLYRMQPGHFIGRMNWSLQVDGVGLFRTDGNNCYPDAAQTVSEEKFHPNFDQCFLRVEHQTLTRLPCSDAIVFCVRSYMTPLEDIRNEGDGPRLADAIEPQSPS